MTPRNYDRNSDDDYPYYRGMKFGFDSKGRVWWRSPKEQNVYIEVESGHEKIVKKLLKIRPEGGSFRITEAGEVLIKISRDGGPHEIPQFVGMAEGSITFKSSQGGIEHNPTEGQLLPGDLWTGIYDGTRLSFMRAYEPKVWWSTVEDFAVRYRLDMNVTPIPMDIWHELNRWKPLGGRFYVTIDGHVITLIDPKQLLDKHKVQFENMNEDQQHLVDIKEERTRMWPIYVGTWDIDEMFQFNRPRRYGDPITDERRNELLGILNFEFNDPVSNSMVPIEAEPSQPLPFDAIPGDGDEAVLEMIESEISDEEE